ncbi:DUF397 domain-containing protein [Saccharopolyspora hirsuta]|uniref:DUF397 domain-containing protein n=1 Tax=Saccharopolyspora hirsuta TaxID=1837 RepID=A0A5M7C337_SACHI|nr:DUF397 domain-containing protein [Saccharopolyspora hirsuta]KAA5836422.1 DUF397 domain-containing protein [Saccharopolyspora hirsuta]
MQGEPWFTSSYTTNAQACVEVAMAPEVVGVRDTKDRDGGTLLFPRRRWADFVNSVKK